MSDFAQLVDLASERLGGRVLYANDEFFAPKENLLKPAKPIFIDDKYTDRGKWMDGWETRRRRIPGYDWCIVQLGVAGILRGVVVDTSFFRGNYPEFCSIEACALQEDFLLDADLEWSEVLRQSGLKGDAQNIFEISDPHRYTHLRFNIYPDGGVARLRVYGEALPNWKHILAQGQCVDLAAVENGGRIIDCSDMFFSAPLNLLMPGNSSHMGDGWETKRRRGPGHDWTIIRLGLQGTIHQIEVDTSHFKGNFPESCSLEICDAGGSGTLGGWTDALSRTQLQADSIQRFDIAQPAAASHVRFNIYPDGGVARLRIYGVPAREARMAHGLRLLNVLTDDAASTALTNCCGSSAWTERMVAKRPFASIADLFETAQQTWWQLGQADWLEAFRHHPKIGERTGGAQSAQAEQWSQQEQNAVGRSSSQLLNALARGNEAYEQRFGHIFIVCAAGKSAEEMLAALNGRLNNDAQTEIRVAAEEQQKITRLRLEKMLEL